VENYQIILLTNYLGFHFKAAGRHDVALLCWTCR